MGDHRYPFGYIPLTMHELGGLKLQPSFDNFVPRFDEDDFDENGEEIASAPRRREGRSGHRNGGHRNSGGRNSGRRQQGRRNYSRDGGRQQDQRGGERGERSTIRFKARNSE